MSDVIAILIVIAIVGAAACYVIKAKRRGEKCIGCPASKKCNGGCCGEK